MGVHSALKTLRGKRIGKYLDKIFRNDINFKLKKYDFWVNDSGWKKRFSFKIYTLQEI